MSRGLLRLPRGVCLHMSRGATRISGRTSMFDQKTKGAPYMKHLDLYARRDPQLAPFLLREVDIEYKRRCRKAQFVFWFAVFTFVSAMQMRLQEENIYYMQRYSTYVSKEENAKDNDNAARRRVFARLMDTARAAFERDQRWSVTDEYQARSILHNG